MALGIGLSPFTDAVAGPLEDCDTAYVRKDYQTAWRLCQSPAAQGLPLAQLRVGLMLRNGQGVAKNPKAATDWYRKAADQGFVEAEVLLGHMYERGEGVSRDLNESIRLLSRAAEQGDRRQQASLCFNFYDGTKFPQNYALSAKWCLRAANQGEGFSQFVLGYLYTNGQGVPLDLAEAHKWWNLAAINPDNAKSVREEATKARERLERRMTLEQVATAQWLAMEWQQVTEKVP